MLPAVFRYWWTTSLLSHVECCIFAHNILDTASGKYYIFLTVHLCIILVGDQLDAQFLLYVYLNPLHVSGNFVLIFRQTIVLIQLLV